MSIFEPTKRHRGVLAARQKCAIADQRVHLPPGANGITASWLHGTGHEAACPALSACAAPPSAPGPSAASGPASPSRDLDNALAPLSRPSALPRIPLLPRPSLAVLPSRGPATARTTKMEFFSGIMVIAQKVRKSCNHIRNPSHMLRKRARGVFPKLRYPIDS